MGGCRCAFRNCQNSSLNSSEMHFFHFPYKAKERCLKWAQNAQKMEFLKLEVKKLRNKVVCEVHFTSNSFMNYRRERLIKTAIPTLYTENGQQFVCEMIEMDGEEDKNTDQGGSDGNDTNMEIDLPEQKPFSNNIQLEDEMITSSLGSTDVVIGTCSFDDYESNQIDSGISSYNRTGLNSSNGNAFNLKVGRSILTRAHKPKLLNYTAIPTRHKLDAPVTYKTFKRPNEIKYVVKKSKTYDHNNLSNENIIIETTQLDEDAFSSKHELAYTPISTDTCIDIIPAKDAKVIKSPSAPKVINNEVSANILEKLEKIRADESNKVDKALYLQTMENQAKQIEELKKLVMEKIVNPAESVSQSSVSVPSSSSSVPQHIRVEKGPAMTKVQLFNGIRKYLNPTMVALLRMEVFGGPERQYRSDEKQLSKELYNLNQEVYEYMRDEWRFRLPAKSEVEVWLKEQDNEELLELC